MFTKIRCDDIGRRSILESWRPNYKHENVDAGDSQKENRARIFNEGVRDLNSGAERCS
jgi:hypothetical protein